VSLQALWREAAGGTALGPMFAFRRKSNHQRLESGDMTNEVAPNETAGMQAVVINVMVPAGQQLGCIFNSSNFVVSVAKGSIAAIKDLREGDLVVQVNGAATEGKQVEDMIAGTEQLAMTVLRKRGGSSMSMGRNASESAEWKDAGVAGQQDEVKATVKLGDTPGD